MGDSTVVLVLVYPSCHRAGFAVSQAARLVSPCSLPLKRQAPHTVRRSACTVNLLDGSSFS
jgi:hypothetical protein